MEVTFLKRGFFQRLFGLPATPGPRDAGCWSYVEGRLEVDLARAAELDRSGGALRLEGGGLPIRVLVVRGDDGEFYAFHNRCTHLGHRRLDPVPGTATIQCCSVGKSTYAYGGERLFGPAPGPVTALRTVMDGRRLTIALP